MESYLVFQRPGENSLVRYIKRRVTRENRNFLAAFSGATGSGKTYAALSLSELLDPEFEEKQIIFDGLKGMLKLSKDKEFMQKKIKVILVDEMQISASSRNWQSKENRLMNYFLSTFRHMNIIVLFTSPYLDFMDSSSNKMLHMELKMAGIQKKEKMAVTIPRFLQYNSDMKKTYRHKLRVIVEKGNVPAMDFMKLKIPSKEIIDLYETKKTEFTRALNEKIDLELQALEDANKPLIIDKRKRLTDPQKEAFRAWATGKTFRQIGEWLQCSHQNVAQLIRAGELKGYNKEEFVKQIREKSTAGPHSHEK